MTHRCLVHHHTLSQQFSPGHYVTIAPLSLNVHTTWCDLSYGPSKNLPSWRHQMGIFSALLVLCAGNKRTPVNSPHKEQWRGALMFSLICTWINGWVKNREAGDLRLNRAHYDVTVMRCHLSSLHPQRTLDGQITTKQCTFNELSYFSISQWRH